MPWPGLGWVAGGSPSGGVVASVVRKAGRGPVGLVASCSVGAGVLWAGWWAASSFAASGSK
ncbi:hypothetical protein ACFQQB_30505 [Nonomuraea rubra]|uniref:hypothetical protein n=1 Tax=Nonomuraea rubra TaxID=46180 RepID=UPI003610CFFC